MRATDSYAGVEEDFAHTDFACFMGSTFPNSSQIIVDEVPNICLSFVSSLILFKLLNHSSSLGLEVYSVYNRNEYQK
jgi:hypothetical protein